MNKGKRSDTLPFISLTRKLERNVAVLFAGQLVNFVFQHLKGPNKLLARLRRQNYFIHETTVGGAVGRGELFLVLVYLLLQLGFGVFGRSNLTLEDDFGRALGAHYRNFGGGPGVVHVGPNVFGVHHVISSAIRFAGDDGDARYRSLAEGIEQLGAVSDDAAPLLV